MPPMTGTGIELRKAPSLVTKDRAMAQIAAHVMMAGLKARVRGHGPGNLGVGGVRGTSQKTGCHGGDTVAEHGVLYSWILEEILSRNRTDGDNVTKVFNGGREGDGDDEQDGLKVEFREDEGRHAEPGRGENLAEIMHAQDDCADISGTDAAEDGNQPQQSAPEQGDQYCGGESGHGDDDGRTFRHKDHAAVARFAERHMDA